jgi:hypothetical protein
MRAFMKRQACNNHEKFDDWEDPAGLRIAFAPGYPGEISASERLY